MKLTSTNKSFELKNAQVIDGTGAPPRLCDISIRDGKIAAVTSVSAGSESSPAAAHLDRPDGVSDEQTIQLQLNGFWVMPGLIDCHVHLCIDGSAHGEVRGDNALIALKMLQNAQACLHAGVTTIRDVGGWNGVEFALREMIESEAFEGPRLSLAGKLLSITSSGADLYGGMYREADGTDEVRKAAREQFKAGADLIKLMASGAVMAKGEKPEATQYGVDEIAAAVDEAQKLGKPVAAHAHAAQAIRNAVEAGVTSIEHGTFLHRDPRLMDLMAEKGTWLVPTLKVFHDMIVGTGIPTWMQEKAKFVHEDHAKSIEKAIAAGVPIAMGTDAATPFNYHGRNAEELQLMADCGMTATQAIQASTSSAARLLGWQDWLGTIERGKAADLIVLRENPLANLRTLGDQQNIVMVFKNGSIVERRSNSFDSTLLGTPHVCCEMPSRNES